MSVAETLAKAQAYVDRYVIEYGNNHYHSGIEQWNTEVMPLLEKAGLRQPLAVAPQRLAA